MKMRKTRALLMAQRRAAKEARMKRGDVQRTKSRYAQKIQRKRARGPVDPRWMWWADRSHKPERSSLASRDMMAVPREAVAS